jgi:formate hydrogenlyase subunit 6/NADH:ubiquinone oxidoreductase subunit I
MNNRKIKLYYHTGTGNSLKIARDIGSKLGGHELISIAKLIKGNAVIEGDLVGFVFPIYFARPPVILQEFIENAEFGDTEYIFAVANGGGLFGKALKILENIFRVRGATLNAGFIIGMPGIHPKIASMQKTTPEEHYEKETLRVDEIVKLVDRRIQHKVETNFGFLGTVFSYAAFRGPYKLSKAHMLDRYLWVDEKCDGCGICAQVCPVGNINLSHSEPPTPIWQHNCANCLACYHHCPKDAIQLGKEEHMKRYRHPEIGLEDIITAT